MAATVPVGAIPAQIDWALKELGIGDCGGRSLESGIGKEESGVRSLEERGERAEGGNDRGKAVCRQIKLYNNGSFFDPGAIPAEDYTAIAERVCGFERVIVECHPALVGESTLRFLGLLERAARRRSAVGQGMPRLEVAMGLETVHPEVLPRLNKGMTLDQFAGAAGFLRRHGIALRAFILVPPPFLPEGEVVVWAERSVAYAMDCGATVAVLIPTRGGGRLEELGRRGQFKAPRLTTVEAALTAGIRQGRRRVFLDVWDLERFADCGGCYEVRRSRLQQMNERQEVLPPVSCERCGLGLASSFRQTV